MKIKKHRISRWYATRVKNGDMVKRLIKASAIKLKHNF